MLQGSSSAALASALIQTCLRCLLLGCLLLWAWKLEGTTRTRRCAPRRITAGWLGPCRRCVLCLSLLPLSLLNFWKRACWVDRSQAPVACGGTCAADAHTQDVRPACTRIAGMLLYQPRLAGWSSMHALGTQSWERAQHGTHTGAPSVPLYFILGSLYSLDSLTLWAASMCSIACAMN